MKRLAPSPLNVAARLERSEVNGPGCRSVIWLQGCPRHERPCPGCGNPEMLPPEERAELLTVEELLSWLLGARRNGTSGVTFTGGEPFLQAQPLAELAEGARAEGLTVVTFTGLTLEEIEEGHRPDHAALLRATDLLVDGPYRSELRCASPLRSSSNQRLHFLSGRLTPQDLDTAGRHDDLELVLDDEGGVTCTGFIEPTLAGTISEALAPRRTN